MVNDQGKIIDECRKTFKRMFPHERDDPFLDTKRDRFDGDYRDFKYVLQKLAIEPGQKVLYVGTGSAFGPYVVSSLVGNKGHVTGYEISDHYYQNIERLKKLKVRNVEVYKQDIFEASLPNGHFDRTIVAAGAPRIVGTEKLSIGQKAVVKPTEAVEFLLGKTKQNGSIVIPSGELGCRWTTHCVAEYSLILRDGQSVVAEKLDNGAIWFPLVGKHGFSQKEIDEIYTRENLHEDFL
jgi:hypothetical protein